LKKPFNFDCNTEFLTAQRCPDEECHDILKLSSPKISQGEITFKVTYWLDTRDQYKSS